MGVQKESVDGSLTILDNEDGDDGDGWRLTFERAQSLKGMGRMKAELV